MRTTDIVVTTIFEPSWLEGYLHNIRNHSHEQSVTIRIIADRRTPASVYAAAQEASRQGFQVDCPDLEEQARYLRRLGVPDDFVPWNSDNRRNIGYLRAWESGADTLISIDDDNFCRTDSDFIAAHDAVGRTCSELNLRHCAGGAAWFNLCELLDDDGDAAIYARGFPYRARRYTAEHPTPLARVEGLPAHLAAARIAANAGLWLDDPDVDAVTRLALRPHVSSAQERDLVLAPGTWSPVNTQNTALHRQAIPAYYYARMGFPVKGMLIDRFGDIWSGYFLQRCAEHLGEVVRVGSPVADHRRTTHNLFADLYSELAGIVLTEELLPWLREVPLSASTYAGCYAELCDALAAQADRFSGFLWDEGGRAFLAATAENMRTWLGAVTTLGA